MEQNLPFGRTDLTPSDARSLIDVKRAVEILVEQGISKPENRVKAVVERVPALLRWLENNGRDFPWRYTTDPWRIYVSEILLQRTRGSAVAEVYGPFFEKFPDAASICESDAEEIYEVIATLGFGNQRTRTLRKVGDLVHHEHGGTVPESLEELKRPYRVGPYSARACRLFAFRKPVALVDANFARVFGRIFGLELPAQPHKCGWLYDLMEALVPDDPGAARAFNLACVDLGALVCTPDSPDTGECPLEPACKFAAEERGSGNP